METLTYNEEIADRQLTLLADELREPYPGYPVHAARLFAPLDTLKRTAESALIIPEGPWDVNDYPDTPNPQIVPDEQTQQELRDMGLELDSMGRPLHPWLGKMLGNMATGSVFGRGMYWKWGPSLTVDSVVLQQDHVLLIERRDTDTLALPGGFIDKHEEPLMAATRELKEETTLRLSPAECTREAYCGLVVDPRMTGNAWPSTSTFVFELDGGKALPEVKGRDDAKVAKWIPIAEALGRTMFASHHFLLETALDRR